MRASLALGTPGQAGEWPLDDEIFAAFGQPEEMLILAGPSTQLWPLSPTEPERVYEGIPLEYRLREVSVMMMYTEKRDFLLLIVRSKREISESERDTFKQIVATISTVPPIEPVVYDQGKRFAVLTGRYVEKNERRTRRYRQADDAQRLREDH